MTGSLYYKTMVFFLPAGRKMGVEYNENEE